MYGWVVGVWLGLWSGELHGQNVYVSRFWHNHQPIYWPEWNSNGGETSRVEYAWDSILLKPNRSYTGSPSQHPENDLVDIFGKADRLAAYQGRPRDALANISQSGGFGMSYSGSLIDNVRQLGGLGQLGYGAGWADGNRQARDWRTPAGGRRLELVGFTYHHSLGPLLPKAVLRKEIQTFKQAYWKAWGGNMDLSDHSKGFFPTEMAYSRHLVDVLVDEGYEWAIVASHHLSRTCPTYFDQFDLASGQYNIFSSPPNRADLLGPSPTSGWWYAQPNPGNAAWNVAPFAYQLHRSEYVDPETGQVKSLILVPSDDVLSYAYGYSNEGVGKINDHIAPFANDPQRPALVMPATDGDNAWGGGFDSWMNATLQLFGGGYAPTAIQDFVDQFGGAAQPVHIEDGAWIFPEVDYGSPYFLKWIEPPVAADPARRYPGTVIDMESPGHALKFWSWAPVITGANWVETAEQILRDEGGSVEAWKIQAPYDWDGTWTNPNQVELAWHIYLKGLDSGFNYYGGLGNDDEVKPALATTRTIEQLDGWMTAERRANDRTPPSVLKPQRFPYNPGGYTFGWFNSVPGGDQRFLKKMPSEFYIWTHAYDLSGIESVTLRVRVDADGINDLNTFENETYAGGPGVSEWTDIAMVKRELPREPSELNAAANNPEINYFITPPELADYYYARIDSQSLPGFRGKLLDYYVEAVDALGNVSRSEIQHVFVEDDGESGGVVTAPSAPSEVLATDIRATQITLSWQPVPGATEYLIYQDGEAVGATMSLGWSQSGLAPNSSYTFAVAARNAAGDSPFSDELVVVTAALEGGSIPFVLDGVVDFPGYLISSDGMTLYAALRGHTLYVATWAPNSGGNDHFIMVSDALGELAEWEAPWAKAGLTCMPTASPFLAAESENAFFGWFNELDGMADAARGGPGNQLEGTIDLFAQFGALPEVIHLAALAYGTGDGDSLVAQTPGQVIDDGNVTADEVFSISTELLRDEDANGVFDRLEPSKGFRINSVAWIGSEIELSWAAFPGRRYHLESSLDLSEGSWTPVPDSQVLAGVAEQQITLRFTPNQLHTQAYFRVVLEP